MHALLATLDEHSSVPCMKASPHPAAYMLHCALCCACAFLAQAWLPKRALRQPPQTYVFTERSERPLMLWQDTCAHAWKGSHGPPGTAPAIADGSGL